jgi:DNA-cytosine methyltransferase
MQSASSVMFKPNPTCSNQHENGNDCQCSANSEAKVWRSWIISIPKLNFEFLTIDAHPRLTESNIEPSHTNSHLSILPSTTLQELAQWWFFVWSFPRAMAATQRSKGSAVPPSRHLASIAPWFLERLDSHDRRQLQDAVAAVAQTGKPLRVGTLCSGTDAPVPVMRHLANALRGGIVIEHTFSCESDPRKQEWIKQNFPDLKYLFGDVTVLGRKNGKALNVLTGKQVRVPAVHVVIAGFVCKSVSSENNERRNHSECIKHGTGDTGETFRGVRNYVMRAKPHVVICENVQGLTQCIGGKPPQVHNVVKALEKVGYSVDWKVLDTSDYVLPQRRKRCWIWAFRGNGVAKGVEKVAGTLAQLSSEKHLSINKVTGKSILGAKRKRLLGPQKITARQQRVVARAMQGNRGYDVIADINKGELRGAHGADVAPTIVANSLPYRVKEKRVLEPMESLALQGIFPEDFPAMEDFSTGSETFLRDLAGNAFSTTVCMAMMLAALCHAPLPGVAKAPKRAARGSSTSMKA